MTKGFVTAVGAAWGKAGRGRKMPQKKIARGQVISYSIVDEGGWTAGPGWY